MHKNLWRHLFTHCFLLAALCHCASVKRDGSTQVVLVQSNPPGAPIWVNGVNVGKTPDLVEIHRQQSPTIELESSKGRVSVPLKTTYRWSESFWPGFIFLTYAPVSWATDLISGTAWDALDTEVIELPDLKNSTSLKNDHTLESPKATAIAPTHAEFLALSRATSEAISKHGNQKNLLPFDQTLELFSEQGYSFSIEPTDKRRLFYNLKRQFGVDSIIESNVELKNDKWVVNYATHNFMSKKTTPGTASIVISESRDSFLPRNHLWSRLVPNTIGLDYVTQNIQLMYQNQNYSLAPVDEPSLFMQTVQALSTLNISNSLARDIHSAAKFSFDAIPLFRVSRIKVRALNLPQLATAPSEREPVFTRWLVHGGYGAEFSYQTGRHVFYLDVVPVLYWNEITWVQSNQDRSATRMSIAVSAELGYTFHLNQNWHLRLFSRSQNEDESNWTDALQSQLGSRNVPISVSHSTTGLSIAYRFEETQHFVSELKRLPRR